MPEKKTLEMIREFDSDADDFQNEEPGRWPTEGESANGVDESKRLDLTKDSKPWEIVEALGSTRAEISLALQKASVLIETLYDEIDRLKNHRHDYAKAYTGRPES